jgi:hypothetical protein
MLECEEENRLRSRDNGEGILQLKDCCKNALLGQQ